MSNVPIWKSEPPAPTPVILTELRDSPALHTLLKPVADAAEQMQAALAALKQSQDTAVAQLAERIEVRDTSFIATLNELVAAVAAIKVQATLATPAVNLPPMQVTVEPSTVKLEQPAVQAIVNVNTQPKAWELRHSYDGFGNLVATKAIPVNP